MSDDYGDLINRLRGHYRTPVTDGSSAELFRDIQFTVPPVQREAAGAIQALIAQVKELEEENEQMNAELLEADRNRDD